LIGSGRRQPTTWPSIISFRPLSFPAALALSVAGGTAIALSLPPFGWWPLGIVGLAAVATSIGRQPVRRRGAVGAVAGLGQFAIGLWWVNEFNVGGYVALVVLSMVFTAIAAAAAFSSRRVGILVGWPAALTLAEWLRGHVPFGGLPLGGIPLGQAAGPLAAVSRLGGPVLVTGMTAAAGAGLAVLAGSLAPAGRAQGRRSAVAGGAVLVLVVAVVAAGRLSPDGSGAGTHPAIRVATVQGGGPRGLHAIEADAAAVFDRQVLAGAGLRPPLDLVVWPEDVVSIDQPVDASPEGATIAELAKRLAATVVVGVVEDVGPDHFRNAAVAWSPAGVIVARYDKVHRVPFGEYVPGRSLVEHLANLALVPRDAIAGHGPGLLDTPAGRLGAVISFEVFFEDRARAAINAGGQILLVPTNASSYRTSQVPAQEVAAAQLRAWETGRDVVQAAPTGFSALIDHDGHVRERSVLGRGQAITGLLTLRHGQTLFVRWGELPVLVLAAFGLIASYRPVRNPR